MLAGTFSQRVTGTDDYGGREVGNHNTATFDRTTSGVGIGTGRVRKRRRVWVRAMRQTITP